MLAITEIYHLLNTIDFDKKSKKRQENKKASNVICIYFESYQAKVQLYQMFLFQNLQSRFYKRNFKLTKTENFPISQFQKISHFSETILNKIADSYFNQRKLSLGLLKCLTGALICTTFCFVLFITFIPFALPKAIVLKNCTIAITPRLPI